MGKWLWRYLGVKGLLWARIVKSIYGVIEWGEEGIKLSRKSKRGTGWWGKVITLGGYSNRGWFLENIKRKVGDGKNTCFWIHKWCGGIPLKCVYPRLFHLCSNKEASIDECGKWVDGEWRWEISWRRGLRERESVMVQQLFSVLSDFSPCAGDEDIWMWTASPSGVNSTKSAYSSISNARSSLLSRACFPAVCTKVWKTKAPQKVVITAWRLLRNRLATCDNLQKRNVMLSEEEKKCKFCNIQGESAEHLFLICPKTSETWEEIERWLGYSTVRPNRIEKHFEMFVNLSGEKKIRKLLMTIWVCTNWLLWRRRNEHRFEVEETESKSIISELKVRTWSWNKCYDILSKELAFSDWCSNELVTNLL